jgi:hypothetical protein
MPIVPICNHVVFSYLVTGLLTWAIPLGLLVVIGIYWTLYALRHHRDG